VIKVERKEARVLKEEIEKGGEKERKSEWRTFTMSRRLVPVFSSIPI